MVNTTMQEMVATACGSDGSINSNECYAALTAMENEVTYLYASSDRDLYEIYKLLFVPSASVPYNTLFANDLKTLDSVNRTLFGDSSTMPGTPGLTRDLLTMADGIDQIRSVGAGQLLSFRNSSRQQQSAMKAFTAKTLADFKVYNLASDQAMKDVVGNRTLVQESFNDEIKASVKEASTDVGQQADEIVADFTSDYADLAKRFAEYKATTDSATALSETRILKIKSDVKNTTKSAPAFQKAFKVKQLNLVNAAVKSETDGFQTNLVGLQSQIKADMTQAAADLTTMITSNRNDFVNEAGEFQSDLTDAIDALSHDVLGSDAQVGGTAAMASTTRANPLVEQLQNMLKTEVAPLLSDVYSSLYLAKQLSGRIAALRETLDREIAANRGAAQIDAGAMGIKIATKYSAVKNSFNADMDAARANMQAQIAAKIAAGRQKLKTILAGVQSAQSSSASQQGSQGGATSAQAQASMTAAGLTAAREQLAGDQAKIGLDSMVSVVGAALTDSQANLSVIQKAQIAAIMKAKGQLSSAQREQVTQLYAQVQAKKAEAAARNAGIRDASFAAQADAMELNSEMAQGGARLDGALQYQNRQTQTLLGEINDILSLAKQSGSGLGDQMAALEEQMPNMMDMLKQKIGQFKSLATANGQAAQTAAANQVGAQTGSALTDTTSGLQVFLSSQSGLSSDLQNGAFAVGADAGSLLSDIGSISKDLQSQSLTGANFVQTHASSALTRAVSEMKSVGGDSAGALTSLLTFNQEQIKEKRKSILTAGDSAMDSAIDAANYLSTAATAFRDLSQQFVKDSANFANKADLNMTRLLSEVNVTVAASANVADVFMSRLGGAAETINNFPISVHARATNMTRQIHQKVGEIQNIILTMNGMGGDPVGDLKASAATLQTYVDSLTKSFEKQRTEFNTYAQQYAIRRIAAITGLSESVVASRANFMASLAESDMSENDRSAKTTDTLQSLLLAVQTAKSNGDVDMSAVAALINGTTNGVAGLTSSFEMSMKSGISNLKQKAINQALATGKSMSGTVDQTSASASMIGNEFVNALDSLSSSETATRLAAASGNKDVYAIAGLLKDSEQSVKTKIAGLLKQVQSGNITMEAAIASVRDVNAAAINSVQDILNVVSGYVAGHVSRTNGFVDRIDAEKESTIDLVNEIVDEHESAEGDMVSDLADNADTLKSLRSRLLSRSGFVGAITAEENDRKAKVDALTNKLSSTLFGTSASSLAQVHRHTTATETLPDTIADIRFSVQSATGAANAAQSALDFRVGKELEMANSVVAEILNLTQVALTSTF